MLGALRQAGWQMEEEPPGGRSGGPLSWLDSVKILELAAHDLNNMAQAALSYIDLAADPKTDAASRARFLATAHEVVRRVSHFAPNLLSLLEARDGPVAGEPSGALSSELEAALAKRRSRFPESAVEVARTGDAWAARARGGKLVALALYHLVDNAARFHRPGQPLQVAVEAVREGDLLRVAVGDRGRGFSPGQEAYAAARFSEPGRVSGAGLGLATVRLVAERCGGSIELGAAGESRGARVVLRLPEAR